MPCNVRNINGVIQFCIPSHGNPLQQKILVLEICTTRKKHCGHFCNALYAFMVQHLCRGLEAVAISTCVSLSIKYDQQPASTLNFSTVLCMYYQSCLVSTGNTSTTVQEQNSNCRYIFPPKQLYYSIFQQQQITNKISFEYRTKKYPSMQANSGLSVQVYILKTPGLSNPRRGM